ncbi:hypothetical protein SAMN05518865_101586 [Duganella sp. CF458]|uniref:hypothetical protein n=1 Tax=Duganella sp. CF458 TaxID=1884368 RepID=UPI0008E2042C|nr:hypothetical protein [Duganella sp. CF458]SFF56738.1 hypothetical protein SAMN05518865_101586 [Duganella sp. CF458]
MYSETRHKQGEAAKEAWKTVDIAGQLNVARKGEAALLAEQLKTEEALQKARRDALIRSMVFDGTVATQLKEPIEKQLLALAGSPQAAVAWAAALKKEERAKSNLHDAEIEFTRAGVEMPACGAMSQQSFDDWAQAHAGAPAYLRAAWMSAADECSGTGLTAGSIFEFKGGALAITQKEVAEARAAIGGAKAASLAARNQVSKLSKEYSGELEKLSADPKRAQDKLKSIAKELGDALAKIEKLPDPVSRQFVSEQRVKALDATLASLAGNADSKGENGSTSAALASLAEWFDKSNVALTDAKKPRLAAALLLRNLEQAKADAAAKDAQLQAMELQLLESKMSWQLEQLRSLSYGHQALQAVGADMAAMQMRAALAPAETAKATSGKAFEDKTKVWKSAASYLDANGRLAAEVNKTEIQRNALDHERAIAYAEGNIAQWNVLISSTINQLAEYGDAGVRKEDITGLVNSIALLFIAKGVQ